MSTRDELWLPADWDVPDFVRAGTSLRVGGISPSPFASLNLASHVGDSINNVRANREVLNNSLALPAEPVWLTQCHSNAVVTYADHMNKDVDGLVTDLAGIICPVLTADCAALLMFDKASEQIAAVHVGWRGFCSGIIHQALRLFSGNPGGTSAWIGPHICAGHYEVGDEVRAAAIRYRDSAEAAFTWNPRGRWQASLAKMIETDLQYHGVERIFAANRCTFAEPDAFFSYRRDNQTGRMANMIWIDKAAL